MFEAVRLVRRPRPGASATLVLGFFKGERLDSASAKRDPGGAGARALSRPEATGEVGNVVEAFPEGRGAPARVLLAGLGPARDFEPGVLRAVAAAVGRRLGAAKATEAWLELDGALRGRADLREAGSALGEGIGLLAWTHDEFKGKGSADPRRTALGLGASAAALRGGIERGLALAESANLARTLSNTPPNVATPAYMAEQARRLARRTGLRCEVIRGEALARHGLEGLISVGRGSRHAPCLIRLAYSPARGGRSARPAVLIGKTMTYDSGGLSLKINNTMKGMKRDKDGGCAVLGAMHAVATLIRPRRPVVALLPAAENSVSDDCYRPDDVIRFRNGVTVEVTNTDAEGRLVLADALCWACEREDPGFIVDVATLTGGIVVALGSVFAGLWCEDDGLRRRIESASAASGERVWRMPMHKDYRDMMKSSIADIVNSAPVRDAHPVQGAAFLSYFVREGVAWAHLDIAGVHAVTRDTGPFVEGATGWGVRLLANLLDGA
jgi:leucyl aminopeptidase